MIINMGVMLKSSSELQNFLYNLFSFLIPFSHSQEEKNVQAHPDHLAFL